MKHLRVGIQRREAPGRGETAGEITAEEVGPRNDALDVVLLPLVQQFDRGRRHVDDHVGRGETLETFGRIVGGAVAHDAQLNSRPVLVELRRQIPVEAPELFAPVGSSVPRLAFFTFAGLEAVALPHFHDFGPRIGPLQDVLIDQSLHLRIGKAVVRLTAAGAVVAFTVDEGEVFRMELEKLFLRNGRRVAVGIEGASGIEEPVVGHHVEQSHGVAGGVHELRSVPVRVIFRDCDELLRQCPHAVVDAGLVSPENHDAGVDELFHEGAGPLQSAVDVVDEVAGNVLPGVGDVLPVDEDVFAPDDDGVLPVVEFRGGKSRLGQGAGAAHVDGGPLLVESGLLDQLQFRAGSLFHARPHQFSGEGDETVHFPVPGPVGDDHGVIALFPVGDGQGRAPESEKKQCRNGN